MVQFINIYQYATFDAVWSDISVISLLNVTKPGCVAAIFKMAAILDFFQLALYPILFSISISIIVPNFMLVTESAHFFHHFLPLEGIALYEELCFDCRFSDIKPNDMSSSPAPATIVVGFGHISTSLYQYSYDRL
jgi:hypothetical protein